MTNHEIEYVLSQYQKLKAIFHQWIDNSVNINIEGVESRIDGETLVLTFLGKEILINFDIYIHGYQPDQSPFDKRIFGKISVSHSTNKKEELKTLKESYFDELGNTHNSLDKTAHGNLANGGDYINEFAHEVLRYCIPHFYS